MTRLLVREALVGELSLGALLPHAPNTVAVPDFAEDWTDLSHAQRIPREAFS